jgi:hypothetical protein
VDQRILAREVFDFLHVSILGSGLQHRLLNMDVLHPPL